MTSATVSGTTTSYTYDGDDVRTQRTQGGTTSFLWDRESGLPLLVDDGSFGYFYAGETPLDQISVGGTASSLLLDPLGSVRGLADGNGALSGARDYGVYGALRSSTGTYGRLGFTGEQMDAETGFVFLRARYHDPVTGRFTSRDTVQPNAPGSQGYHVYAYAANSPATITDPSGHLVLGLSITNLIALGMLTLAVQAWWTVNQMQQIGAIELCTADSICGRVLESPVATVSVQVVGTGGQEAERVE